MTDDGGCDYPAPETKKWPLRNSRVGAQGQNRPATRGFSEASRGWRKAARLLELFVIIKIAIEHREA